MDVNSTSASSIGYIFVERDGSYELDRLDRVHTNDRTFWGQYRGVTMKDGDFYHTYLKQTWNPMTEQYEGTESYISTSAMVHPRVKIHHDVTIEAKAIVGENVELLAGARVAGGKIIEPETQFHHLTSSDSGPLMSSAAA